MTKQKLKKPLFTKGNWHAVGAWVEHEDDKIADICSCNPDDFGQKHLNRSYDEIRANATLIAAAPAMLNALIECVKCMEESCNQNENEWHDIIIEAAKDAINYALGGNLTNKIVN
jgi:hypothetical protein